jgi:sulfate transport system permease protein
MSVIRLERLLHHGIAREARHSLPWGRWGLRAAALSYLIVLVLIPLIVIFQDGLREGLGELWRQVTLPVAWSALMLTMWTSTVMTIINTVMGALTAYVLVRYEFPGKSLLVILYGPQQALGAWLKNSFGISIIFAPPGIILALMFITFPIIVRAVQPVLEELDRTQEDAAATLGAQGWVIFRRITFPPLIVPLVSGALLSFSRAIGEFGAIIVVAGNIPLYSQTAAVYVLGEVESENRLGASAVSIVMVAIAFCLILLVDWLQKRGKEQP